MKYNGKKEAKAWSREAFRGALVSTITTNFTDDLKIDEEGIRKNVRHSIELEADALFAIGNVGEFFSLTMEERKRVCEIVIDEVNGEIPVIIQTASHCADDCVELTKHAQDKGADLVAIITPYFQAKSEQAIYEWFKYVGDRIDIGFILYNSPLSTPLSAEFIGKLSNDIDNLSGVKEGTCNLMHALDIQRACENRIWVSDPLEDHWLYEIPIMDPPVLCCNWVVYFFQKLNHKPLQKYTQLALKGEMDKAKEIRESLNPVRKILAKVFNDNYARGVYPIGHFKYWCELYGLPGGPVRPPLLNITQEEKDWLRKELEAIGMI